ncbi:hypothetical protein, partial [Paenibacillus popilliae]
MNRKMTLKKLSQISLIVVVISCNLLTGGVSPLYAEGQTPTAEFGSLLTKGEEQLQALKQE